MQNSDLLKLLDNIQGQIKTFDSKAQIALGIDSLLAGLIGTQLIKAVEFGASGMLIRFSIVALISALSITSLAVSFIFAIRTVHPQLHLCQPASHFFFCHLVDLYGRDFSKSATELINLSEGDMAIQLGTQIQTNAIICDVKASRCRKALLASGIALGGYLLMIYPFASMAYEAARIAKQ